MENKFVNKILTEDFSLRVFYIQISIACILMGLIACWELRVAQLLHMADSGGHIVQYSGKVHVGNALFGSNCLFYS